MLVSIALDISSQALGLPPPPLSSFLYSKKAVRVKGVQGCEPTELKAVGTSQSQITSLSPLEQCVYGISYLVTLFSLIF